MTCKGSTPMTGYPVGKPDPFLRDSIGVVELLDEMRRTAQEMSAKGKALHGNQKSSPTPGFKAG